jgi:hypothetical protein
LKIIIDKSSCQLFLTITDTITSQNIESSCMSLPGHRRSKAFNSSVSLSRIQTVFFYFLITASAIKQIKVAHELASFPKEKFQALNCVPVLWFSPASCPYECFRHLYQLTHFLLTWNILSHSFSGMGVDWFSDALRHCSLFFSVCTSHFSFFQAFFFVTYPQKISLKLRQLAPTCLSVCNSSRTANRILIKFYVRELF